MKQSLAPWFSIDAANLIKPLLDPVSSTAWLQGVVSLANMKGQLDSKQLALSLEELDDEQLSLLARAFARDDIIKLLHAIFFYKLCPEGLFSQAIHPEKLVSVKYRLSLLYDFLIRLNKTLADLMRKRGFEPEQDLMFHSDELPKGIALEAGGEYRETILAAVRQWRLNIPMTEEQVSRNQVQDMCRAYKYWFNPNRLIDAAMILYQRIGQAGDFYHELQTLYRKFSTAECLDLYGYFSNHDTRYLLYTLTSVARGDMMDWLPPLTNEERLSVEVAYVILADIMNTLRDELAARQIVTSPYEHQLPDKKIRPGRRNRDAVFRILRLYSHKRWASNTRLEMLFQQMES